VYLSNCSAKPSVLWHCWLGGRKGIRPVKNWVVGCWRGLERGADLHIARLMSRPLTVSCYAYAVVAMGLCLSVSVTSWCSTKTAKYRIRKTTPHNSPGTLLFWCQRSQRNFTGVTRTGTPNAGVHTVIKGRTVIGISSKNSITLRIEPLATQMLLALFVPLTVEAAQQSLWPNWKLMLRFTCPFH